MRPNDVVAFVLRSPMHALIRSTMLITVAGRKTGRHITTPVNYARCGDELWVLSSRDRNWWRNIRKSTPVSLRLNGRNLQAAADLVLEPRAVAAQLREYVRLLPAASQPLGMHIPATADEVAARLSTQRLFVNIRLEAQAAPPVKPTR